MKDILTDELNDELNDIKSEGLKNYFKKNNNYLAEDKKAFTYYMKDVIDRKNLNCKDHKIKLKDIYSFAGVSEKYQKQRLNNTFLHCG